MPEFVPAGFLIFGLFFVSRDFELRWSSLAQRCKKTVPAKRTYLGSFVVYMLQCNVGL